MHASDLEPGDIITGPLGDEKKAQRPNRTITHVTQRNALVRFRCFEGTKDVGGEVWELPCTLTVPAARPKGVPSDVDRAITGAEQALLGAQ